MNLAFEKNDIEELSKLIAKKVAAELRTEPQLPQDQTAPTPGVVEQLMYTVQQAAQACNVSTRTISNWRDRGLIRVVKHGNCVRIPVSEISRLAKPP